MKQTSTLFSRCAALVFQAVSVAAATCPRIPIDDATKRLLNPILIELHRGTTDAAFDKALALASTEGTAADEALAILFSIDFGVSDGDEVKRCHISERGQHQMKAIESLIRCRTIEKSRLFKKETVEQKATVLDYLDIWRAGNLCEIE